MDSAPPSSPLQRCFYSDHKILGRLLERLIAAIEHKSPPVQLREFWSSFEDASLSHLEMEEKVLMPDFLKSCERDARSILAEHRHLRARIAALKVSLDLGMLSADALRLFADELEAHAKHEEASLYRWVDKNASLGDRARILGMLTDAGLHRLARTG